jgi:hypothetical protein
MVIAKNRVKKSRQARRCSMCGTNIPRGGAYWRTFGCAERGDKPYRICVCLRCDSMASQ